MLLVELLVEVFPLLELFDTLPFDIELFDILPFDIELVFVVVVPPPDVLPVFDIEVLFAIDVLPPDIELFAIDELLFIIEFEFVFFVFVFVSLVHPKLAKARLATAPKINFLFIYSPVFSNVNLRAKMITRFMDKLLRILIIVICRKNNVCWHTFLRFLKYFFGNVLNIT